MWGWRPLLPDFIAPVTLGEGGTPLVQLDLGPDVWAKDERTNPTGSFKDRMAALVVSWARAHGASTVAVASSGNAAVATAAYAAAAGLRCVVLGKGGSWSSRWVEPALRRMGADVRRIVSSWRDRWTALDRGVHEDGWFPLSNYRVPPVGSHPVGVRAYRTIAYEIAAQLDWSVPDWIVVPVSRGDALSALVAGFDELKHAGWISRIPRTLAVVRFPSLRNAVLEKRAQPRRSEAPDRVDAVSISDPQSTATAARAVRHSAGDVLTLGDEQLRVARDAAAARGWLVELSSAAAFAGASELARRGEEGGIIALVTARA